MMQRIWVAAFSIAIAGNASAGSWSGRVFLDANGNGIFDAGETPVKECVVSDERTLARTDAEGRYQIEMPAGAATLFVVNASNTWPAGSWWRPVKDGRVAGQQDFALRSERQEGPLFFAHGTDPHFGPEVAALYERYVKHVNELRVPVQFVVHTGDLVTDARRSTPQQAELLFDEYLKANAALKPDLRNVIGSHDLTGVLNAEVKDSDPDRGHGLFRRRIGPAHHAFRWGPYHFIAMDGTTVEGHAVRDGLTKESVDWALEYLSRVETNEPIVLLTHQPMFEIRDGLKFPDDPVKRPHEIRLREALTKHKLFLTLVGQVHDRLSHGWAGAPHLTGGAISYAWQGQRPYPTTPRGYVLYRVEGLQMERVFLDWAERDSIDIHLPDFKSVLFGRQVVRGLVPDFDNALQAVEVQLGSHTATARTAPMGKLSKSFAAELDAADLSDGVYELRVKAVFRGREHIERQPVVVYSAKPTRVETRETVRLHFSLEGELPDAGRVICNGKLLGSMPAGRHKGKEFTFEVPSDRVRRLNEIRIVAEDRAEFPSITVKGVSLTIGERRYRDIRYSPPEPRLLYPERTAGTVALTAYVDVQYTEPTDQP
jgi:hypothetical protein